MMAVLQYLIARDNLDLILLRSLPMLAGLEAIRSSTRREEVSNGFQMIHCQ